MDTLMPQMQLAMEYVESTNTVVFLTGKAGTGKTLCGNYVKTCRCKLKFSLMWLNQVCYER
jgi:hypothetical protein